MDFIRGMDVSSYFEMQDRGFCYYDEENHEVDVLEYAVKRGFNFARLRIWNEPENVPESGGYCNLEQTIRLAQKIRKLGIGYALDFHYSDWWADPGKQNKPKAWEKLSVDELETAVYQYTKDCLKAMEKADVYPQMIQIGNEIRTGMLFPDGAVPNWENLARFVNAGIRAVRETQGDRDAKIILHLDQGGKYEYFKEWFDHMIENGVQDFDIIGLSYYPFWHGQYYELKNNMDSLAERYGKELLVMETAHAFRKSGGKFFREAQEHAAGFPATPEAQRKVLELIISIIANTRDNKGMGFFYWEPFSRAAEDAEGWGTCMGLMDENGRPTEGYRAVSFQPETVNPKTIVKIYCPEEIKGEPPKKVRALYMDGTTEEKTVLWQEEALEQKHTAADNVLTASAEKQAPKPAGILTGSVMEVPEEWSRISIRRVSDEGVNNLLPNGDFTREMEGFLLERQSGEVTYGVNENGFWFQAFTNFCMELTSEKIPAETGASYRAKLVYRGGNTTGTNLTFWIKDENGDVIASCEVFPEDEARTYSLDLPELKAVQMQAGVSFEAPSVSGEIFRILLEKV